MAVRIEFMIHFFSKEVYATRQRGIDVLLNWG